jgi:parvulin-like peptidyl-prolyl isomerase
VKRLPVIVAALVVVALVGGFASYLVFNEGAPAFTAHGQQVSQSEVDSELTALADNAALKKLIRQSQASPISTLPGTISATYTAGWLSLRVAQTYVDRTVTTKRLHVDASDRRAGDGLAVQLLGSQQVLNTLPGSLRTNLRNRFARIASVTRSLLTDPSPRLRDAALAACPSHRFVAHILLTTLADAQAVKATLAGGGDFATQARQHSTDQASAAVGGELGCLDSQQFVAPFAQAAQTLPVGQVSDPVQTQYGFHLILVHDQPPASEIQSVALASVLGLARGQAVTVDPRYGVWDRRNGRVVAPTTAARPSAPSTPSPTG